MIRDVVLPSPFRHAIKQSMLSSCDFKMGAVITRRSRVLSTGFNRIKTHPFYANPDKHLKLSIHAEIDCLIDHSAINGDTIYVYREDKWGWPALARPCIDCQKTLREHGIKKMFYSTPHSPYYAEENI